MAKKDTQQVCFRTSIGGQALMEGILMRGPEKQAIVCRTENGIVEKVEELSFVKDKHPVLGWPFVRGVFTLVDSLAKGMKALTYSASLLPEDQQEEPTKFDLWLEKRLGSEKAEKIVIGSAAVLGVLLALALFIFLPTFIAGLIPGLEGRYTLRSLVEGVIKLAIFLGYLGLVARMKEIKRLFSYHGAEHKTIFCYEKGLPVVIILGLLAGLLIQADNTLLRIALRLLLLPVIIALAYELNRWAGRHDTNIVSRIVTWPGKQLQRLTTAEPDDGMIECAIRAMELVIPEEKGKDAW